MTPNRFYILYLLSITLLVATSSGDLDSFILLRHHIHLILLAICLVYAMLTDRKRLLNSLTKTKYVGLFVLLAGSSLFRSNIPNANTEQTTITAISLCLYYVNTVYILYFLLEKNDKKKIINLIFIPFLVFAVLNLIYFSIGYTKPALIAVDSSKMMQLIGYSNFPRINFYLVTGVNSYGSINGALLTIAIISFLFKTYSRTYNIIVVLIFLSTIFLTDCRGALGFCLFSTFFAIWINRTRSLNVLNLLPYFAMLAPFVFVFLLPIVASSSYFNFLSRGSNDLATGNARVVMWEYIVQDFYHNQNLSPFGFGDYGLYKTPAYNFIAKMFATKNIVLNPQNSLIDIVLDFGYVTLAVFFLILITGVKRIKEFWIFNPVIASIVTGLIMYLSLIGITESFIGFYYLNAYLIFVYIFCLMCLVSKNNFALIDQNKVIHS